MKAIALMGVGLLTLSACQKSPEAAAIENNTEMLADQMEAEAARQDALVDNMMKSPSGQTNKADGNWSYAEQKDEMRGSTGRFARVSSSTTLHLGFPYGETTPILTIRKGPKFGFNIFISSEGQPQCRSYRNDKLSIKIDDGPIREWSCAEAADGSPGVVFFNREQSLLAALKKGKRMVVEIDYYNAGRQQLVFPIAGLKW